MKRLWRTSRATRRLTVVGLAGLALVASACGGSGRFAGLGASRTTAAPTTSGGSTSASGTTTPGGTPATTAPPSGGAAPLSWQPCTGALDGFQCATLMVPINPDDPSSTKIGLSLDRKQATGTRIGSLVYNPGGPGESAVDELPDVYEGLSSDLKQHFDIVGVDPPGVGHSDGVTCLSNAALGAYYHVDPDPTTPAGFQALVTSNQQLAAGCEAHSGAILPYVSTVDAAKDLDLVRQALGDQKLTYLGFSYGTFLGATYAQLFPTHIRAMVLDGALDPTLPIVSQLDQQSAALDKQLNQFFTACAAQSTCSWKPGGSLPAAYAALENQVRTAPIAAGGGRTVGPSELLYGTGYALYDQTLWTSLAQALAALQKGDGSQMLHLFDQYFERDAAGNYSDSIEAETAVDCLDRAAPPVAQVQADAAAAHAAAPVFGVANLYGELACDVWPVKATGSPGPVTAKGSPPIVVVGSTGDPVTPYPWAQSLVKQLANAVLLTRTGNGHTAYFSSQCIQNQLDVYLVDLRTPATGTVCPSGSAANPTS